MYRTMFVPAVAATALLWSAGFATAQQFGTAAEAKAMLDRAVTEMKAGEGAAIAKFNDKDNKAFLHARLGLGSDQLAPYKALSRAGFALT